MSFKALTKYLPTSESSHAYAHMLEFPLSKNSGIRKHIPNAIDVRVNAIAVVILSAVDIVKSGVKLALCVGFVFPLLLLNMKPIVRNFICSITTFVKATLAIVHGKNEGLLSLTTEQRMRIIALRNPAAIKNCIFALPTGELAEKEFLKEMVVKGGINQCLTQLFKRNNFALIHEIILLLNAKSNLLEVVFANSHLMTPRRQHALFQEFASDSTNFLINVLADKNVSNKVKHNLEDLAKIQTNSPDGDAALTQIINEIEASLPQLPGMLEIAKKEKDEARAALHRAKEKMGMNASDALPQIIPPELEPTNQAFILASQNATIAEVRLNSFKRGLVNILNHKPELILTISPESLAQIKDMLNPTFQAIKALHIQGNVQEIQQLYERIPNALATCFDEETGESYLMHLLSIQDYEKTLALLMLDSEKLNRKAVFDLLENAPTYFQLSQEGMANILQDSHGDLVKIYNEQRHTSLQSIAGMSRNEKLTAIGFHLCKAGGSIKDARGFSILNTLANSRAFTMQHKRCTEKLVKLEDIPEINTVADGVALGKKVGMTWTIRLKLCLEEAATVPEINLQAKHIIKWCREKLNSDDPEGTEIVKKIFNFIDEEGNSGCKTRKQDAIASAWNMILDVRFVPKEDDPKKLIIYAAGFKEKIAMQILPDDVHRRLTWGLTLYDKRFVEIAKMGDTDGYFGGRVSNNAQEALAAFDALYQPHEFVAYLRAGLNDKSNKLTLVINNAVYNFLSSNADIAETLTPLMTDYNGQITDFALFCILQDLSYINLHTYGGAASTAANIFSDWPQGIEWA